MSRGTWTTLLSWQMKTLPTQWQVWCWHPEQPARKNSKQVRSGDISAFTSAPVSFISKGGMQRPARPTPWIKDPPQKLEQITWLLGHDFSVSLSSSPQILYGLRIETEMNIVDFPWKKCVIFKVVLKSLDPAEVTRVLLMHWVSAQGKGPSQLCYYACLVWQAQGTIRYFYFLQPRHFCLWRRGTICALFPIVPGNW